jgi:hypothetical protein
MDSAFGNVMKHRLAMCACVGLALAGGARAEDIRKCVDHGMVTYQNAPCNAGQVDAGLVKLPDYADPPQRDAASAPARNAFGGANDDNATSTSPAPLAAPAPSQAAFPFRTSIALGMTDDQVLNLPAWGRPTRIERIGRHRGWREEWTYAEPNEVRTLSFVEGRLANIGVETPVTRLAEMSVKP